MRGADPAGMSSNWRKVSANDPGITRDRLIRLVDGIPADDEHTATYPGLRIDNGIAADDRRPAGDPASDIDIPEEDEDTTGKIALNLHGAEDAGGIVDLLSLADEDVLIEVGAGSGALGSCDCCR